MDLWIRSQKGCILKKEANLYLDDEGIDCRILNDSCDCLGTYKSKERALEVLDEIQNLMIPVFEQNERFYDSPNCFNNGNIMIYEMPKE